MNGTYIKKHNKTPAQKARRADIKNEARALARSVRRPEKVGKPKARKSKRRPAAFRAPTENAYKLSAKYGKDGYELAGTYDGWGLSYGNKGWGFKAPTLNAYQPTPNPHAIQAIAPETMARVAEQRAEYGSGRPSGARMPLKDDIVPFREVIAVVDGSVNYSVYEFNLNPGLAESFPILSQKAATYERYQFQDLRVVWLPTVASLTGQGMLTLSADLEGGVEHEPSNMVEQMSNSISESTKPIHELEMQLAGVLRHPSTTDSTWFVRSGDLAPGTDARVTDAGMLYIGLSGCANTNEQGYLMLVGNVALYDVLSEPPGLAPSQFTAAGVVAQGSGINIVGAATGVQFPQSYNGRTSWTNDPTNTFIATNPHYTGRVTISFSLEFTGTVFVSAPTASTFARVSLNGTQVGPYFPMVSIASTLWTAFGQTTVDYTAGDVIGIIYANTATTCTSILTQIALTNSV